MKRRDDEREQVVDDAAEWDKALNMLDRVLANFTRANDRLEKGVAGGNQEK